MNGSNNRQRALAGAEKVVGAGEARGGGARLALLCVAQFVVVLDVTIVAIALPAIRRDLGFDPAGLQWVISAYTLTFGGGLLIAGRVADLFGRRRAFRAGLLVFTAASLACALAHSAAALIAARAVQGAGAALVAPSALALLVDTAPEGRARSRALAVWTAAAAGGGASGWVLGGLISSGPGWAWVFAINVPIGLAGAALAGRLLPRDGGTRDGGLDLPGAVTLTLGLAAILFGLSRTEHAGPSAGMLVPLAAGALLLALFTRVQTLVPRGALRRPGLARGALVALAITGTTSPAMFLAVLQAHTSNGLLFAPLNLAVIGGSLASPRLPRAMPGGLAAIAAGCLLLAAGAPMTLAFVVMGAGLGAASVASTRAGMGEDADGFASGLLNTAAQLGTAIGLALVVAPAAALGFRWGWLGCAAIALSSSVATSREAGSSPACGSASGSAYAPKQTRSRSVKTPTESACPSESGIAGSTSTHSAPSR
jgi:MFS family permease